MAIRNPTLDAFQPRGFRNLNPGNIEDGPFARRQPGYKGTDGRFAVFDSMENGLGAQSALLQSYGNRGLNTLNAIVNRYAPAADNNNTAAYSSFLSKRMGIAPDAPLDMSNPNVRRDLALAMAEHENGKDPRSFMALGSDSMPQIGGEQPQAPQGAQSISLGDQENTQPLNNIGSTLANMGASIASLDRHGTGIASLNASKVASNLADQEQAREAQGGWKYVGQTQNGQGLMFQGPGGQVRVEPVAPGFAGNKENQTALQKDYAWADGDSEKMKLVNASHGIEDKPAMDDSLKNDLGSLWAAGDDTIMSRQDAKSRQDIMAAGIKQIRDAGLDPKEVMANRIAYKGDLADDKRRSQIIGALDTYKGEFLAGAKQAADYAKRIPEEFQQKPLNEIYQWAQVNAGTPEGQAINDLKIGLESMNRGYNRAVTTSSNGNVTGEKRIAELFNPALPTKMILSGIGVLTGDVTRLNKFAVEARDNARARRAGKAIPHPEIEDEDKAIQSIVGGSGGNGKKTIRENSAPSDAHAQALREHPEMREQFDAKFGPGAAAKILGN